LKKVWKTLG